MKYFKHLVDSGDDPDIGEAMARFREKGYYCFFRTLEIMAREFSIENPGQNEFNFKWFLGRFSPRFDRKTLEKILSFYQKRKRIFFKIDGDTIWLNCPKLRDLSDEYTQKLLSRKKAKCRDIVGTLSGQSPKPRATARGNKNKNKIYNKNIYAIYFNYKKSGRFLFCDICLTFFLIYWLKENDPKAKVPNFETERFFKWVQEMRLARTEDDRSREEIIASILYSQKSSFWRIHVKSAANLRDKIPTLLLQIEQDLEKMRDKQTYVGGRGLPAHIQTYITALEKRDRGTQ